MTEIQEAAEIQQSSTTDTEKQLKNQVIAASMLAPLIGGAIIYYSLKKKHPAYAKLGNTMSFLSLPIWIGLWFVTQQIGVPLNFISGPSSLAGIVLAIMLVSKLK